jgi:hypothetical protein
MTTALLVGSSSGGTGGFRGRTRARQISVQVDAQQITIGRR